MVSERGVLAGSIALFTLAAAVLVYPFFQAVLLAALLAYLLGPLHERLRPRVGERVSAVALLAVSTVAVLAPALVVGYLVVRELADVLETLSDLRVRGVAVDRLFENATLSLNGAAASQNSRAVLGTLSDVFGGVAGLFVGIAVFLFTAYYLLVDGERLVAWIRENLPVRPTVADRLIDELDRLMYATVVGNALVALVQGVLTGVGFLAADIPNALFWGIATALLSLLPIIGASIVWIPAVGYLLWTGQTLPGVFLLVWGAAVVSTSDNYLRPVITARSAHISPGVFVLGIFGGAAVLGFAGLFYGPVIFGFLRVLLLTYTEEY
jgi:predicted PurR-regulated permease PerM